MRGLRIGIAVAGLLLFSVSPSLAAQVDGPLFVTSDPEAGDQLEDAPERIQVTFSEPLDPSSELLVIDGCGRLIDGDTIVTANTMETGLKKTPSGAYTVRYRAKGPGGLSGETSGGFQFVVADGPSCGGRHGAHDPRHGGKHKGGKEHEGGGRHESSGSPDHSNMSHSNSRHSDSTDHSGMSHQGGRHGKDHKGMDHKGMDHGSDHSGGGNGKHGTDHGSSRQDESSPASTTLAAPQGPQGRLGVEGSAVAMALGAALLLGTAGGWLIRTKNLFL
ncbi:MAG: copper resistance CopC family protein [Actinomycetota bacterium]